MTLTFDLKLVQLVTNDETEAGTGQKVALRNQARHEEQYI